MKAQVRLTFETPRDDGGREYIFDRELSLPPPELNAEACSTAHYCPYCGRFWALMEVKGSPGAHAVRSPCEGCLPAANSDPFHNEYYVPGSILNGVSRYFDFDIGLMKELPLDLLIREFLIHYQGAINGQVTLGP